jgi:hypothetical protein
MLLQVDGNGKGTENSIVRSFDIEHGYVYHYTEYHIVGIDKLFRSSWNLCVVRAVLPC